MEHSSQNGKSETVPVYLSFKTFQSVVQSLRTHGLPDSLDRTAFGSRSGAEQTQILSAFRFLGLLNDSHKTQDHLRALVAVDENSEEEKAVLTDLLKERYANVFALNVEAATPAQLAKAIEEYGAGGATRDRAVRFFIKACEHCGIKLSPRLTARKPRSPSVASDSDTPQTKGKKNNTDTSLRPPVGQAIMTVELPKAGGTLTISGTFNPFILVGDERDLVFGISDLVTAFQEKQDEE